MKLPSLWVWLEGPHLEPFEALLDEFAALDVDLMFGPALVLQSGLGAIVALSAIGARCWLDLGTAVEVASAQALGRVLARSAAHGLVVDAASADEALALLVRSAPGRRVLVRCGPEVSTERLGGLAAAGVTGCLLDLKRPDWQGVTGRARDRGLDVVVANAWDSPPPNAAAIAGWIVRGLDRADDPLAEVVALQQRMAAREVTDGP